MSFQFSQIDAASKDERDPAHRARARGQSLVSSILDIEKAGHPIKNPWVEAAKARTQKRSKVLGKGQYLAALEKQMSAVDTSALPAHMRGKFAALKKSSAQMRGMASKGTLSEEMEMAGVGRASSGAFDMLSLDGRHKSKTASLFDLTASASDGLTRRDLSKSFGRGLVSDVAAQKGTPWDKAADGLASLGMISKKDPRLEAKGGNIAKKAGLPQPDFDAEEVNSGTAATSVMQLGRSLDDATATLGNRMNSAMKGLQAEGRGVGPADKARHHHDRAALNEATGLAALKAGGSKKESVRLFTLAGSNTQRAQTSNLELMMSGKKNKKVSER